VDRDPGAKEGRTGGAPVSAVARRAVVTGGAGFVGSHLVDKLLGNGWTVTAVDCFEPFYSRRQKEQNVRIAREHPAFHLAEVDTRDAVGIGDVIARAAPSVVVDFAARAGVRPSLIDPQLYIDINVVGLQNTLMATARVGAKFVFASSSSVYGADPRHPFSEDQMNVRPESPYAATKIAGEALVFAHHALANLPVGIARLFTVFGPRQRPDLAIHGLIDCEESALTVNVGSHRRRVGPKRLAQPRHARRHPGH
jgi:UDP-glucuronate 4-epimerase